MKPKIADSELEVMRLFWREKRPLSFKEIRTELESTTKWSKSTIQTFVTRLTDKGILSKRFHYVTLYSANVTEEEYVHAEEKIFLDKVYAGDAKNFVASLCQSGKLNEGDIDELRQFFKVEG